MKTPSHSSTGSSSQSHSSLSRNPSTTNPGVRSFSRSYPHYKTYEHHLMSPDDPKLKTPTASSSRHHHHTNGQDNTSPDDRRAETPGLGHDGGTEATTSPHTPTSNQTTPRGFWASHRSRAAFYPHLRKRTNHNNNEDGADPQKIAGIPDMDAMTIIEAIFNPIPGRENTPFTYIPETPPAPEVEEELTGEAEHHELQSHDGGDVAVGKRMGWRRRKTERRDTTSSVLTVQPRHVSTGGAAGRNPSPSRLPRCGSSRSIHA